MLWKSQGQYLVSQIMTAWRNVKQCLEKKMIRAEGTIHVSHAVQLCSIALRLSLHSGYDSMIRASGHMETSLRHLCLTGHAHSCAECWESASVLRLSWFTVFSPPACLMGSICWLSGCDPLPAYCSWFTCWVGPCCVKALLNRTPPRLCWPLARVNGPKFVMHWLPGEWV